MSNFSEKIIGNGSCRYCDMEAHTDSLEIESTPDGMEKLEWVDEFEGESWSENTNGGGGGGGGGIGGGGGGEDSQLYHYYAKTFENTGEFLTQCCHNCRQQDPHLYDSDLATPLHYAAAWGHAECVAVLLKHHAPINVVNSDGYSPLHVGAGFVEVTRLLIKHGALVNAKTLSDGKTALHLAIENRCSASAQLLLQTNININETDDEGETPLMLAIICSLHELAVELITRGARINLQDKRGSTALYFAAIGRHLLIAQLLLDRGARRLPSHHLLHQCVGSRSADYSMVQLLLEHGESLSVRDCDNCTPIMLAIHRQLPKMLAYMLDQAEKQRSQGLYTDAQDEGLLLFAVQQIDDIHEFTVILRILLAKLPSARRDLYSFKAPTVVCGFVYAPLARAISLRKLDIAQLLLREGCNLTQIEADHVLNELCFDHSPQSLALAQLLRHAGLRFPLRGTTERNPTAFHRDMRELSSEPQSLQSLSRQVIRQQLLLGLHQHPARHQQYPPTEQSSTLARMVDEGLCMPQTLKKYVSEFSDVPSIRGAHTMLNRMIRSIESWD